MLIVREGVVRATSWGRDWKMFWIIIPGEKGPIVPTRETTELEWLTPSGLQKQPQMAILEYA